MMKPLMIYACWGALIVAFFRVPVLVPPTVDSVVAMSPVVVEIRDAAGEPLTLATDRLVERPSEKALLTLLRHRHQNLLSIASQACDGSHGMTMGFDTWWLLSEGRWFNSVKGVPGLTDTDLRELLFNYAREYQMEWSDDLRGYLATRRPSLINCLARSHLF